MDIASPELTEQQGYDRKQDKLTVRSRKVDRAINMILIGVICAGALSVCAWNTWLTVTAGTQADRMDRFADKFRRDDAITDALILRLGNIEGKQNAMSESLNALNEGQRQVLVELKRIGH